MRGKVFYALALGALGVALAGTVPWRGLFEPDESRYALVARGMLQENRWLVPYLEGRPYTHKPPLYLWLVALLRACGLPWTPAAVLPAFLPALALLLLFPSLARKLGLSKETGFWAAGALAASPLFATMALAARMDMLLTLFLTVALAHAFALLGGGEEGSFYRRNTWIFWLSVGMAVMSKGPVALALIFASLLLFALVREEELAWRRLFSGWAWLCAIALPLAWLIPASLEEGRAWLEEILIHQSAGRMVASFAHREPFYFHLLTWPFTGFPSGLLGLAAAIALYRRRQRANVSFLAASFLAIFGFFSAISGKLVVYLLPLVPISVLLALKALELPKPWVRWSLAFSAFTGLSLAGALFWLPRLRQELLLSPALTAALGAGLALAGVFALWHAFRQRLAFAFLSLCAGGLWFTLAVIPAITWAVNQRLCVEPVARRYGQLLPSSQAGFVYREAFSGLPLYGQRPFRRLQSREELVQALRQSMPVVLTQKDFTREQEALAGLPLVVERFPYRQSFLLILRLAP
jgi:4-amino-4-deoxy-L-arabinose transferase-like glycosyltransferase